MVRSLLAAERSCTWVGVLVFVDRLVVCGLVVGSVVVAVDIGSPWMDGKRVNGPRVWAASGGALNG